MTRKELERQLSRRMDMRYSVAYYSPILAKIAAINSMSLPSLGTKAIQNKDEVITSIAETKEISWALSQAGAVPVFVDVSLSTLTPTLSMVANAITEKTKAIFLQHNLGNPFDTVSIRELAESENLLFIEDFSGAMGAKSSNQLIGTFGNISVCGDFAFTDDSLFYENMVSLSDMGMGMDDQKALNAIQRLGQMDSLSIAKNVWWERMYKKLSSSSIKDNLVLPCHLETSIPNWSGFSVTKKSEGEYPIEKIVAELGSRVKRLFTPPQDSNLPKSGVVNKNTLVIECFSDINKAVELILGWAE